MGMQEFFMGGEMMWLFPIVMMILFVVMMIIRSLMTGRAGFGPMGRGLSRRRDHFRRGWALDEATENGASASLSAPDSEADLTPTTRQIHLDKARAYQAQISSLLKSTAGQKAPARQQALVGQVNQWVQAVTALADRVHSFQQNTLIQQDMAAVPKAIADLEDRLANESSEPTRLELERTLANRTQQLAALQRLQDTIKQAEIKIERTLSALGTIYSQLLTAQSTDQVADYRRLSAEIDEEVLALQDHLEALEEVKLSGDESSARL